MPGPHRKMVKQNESATVSERGLREKRVDRRGLGTKTGASGVRKLGATSNGDNIR